MNIRQGIQGLFAFGALFVWAAWGPASAADQPRWGERYSRNMVSAETGLPETFDPRTGRNVKWVVELGTSTYATPVVARGRVLIGTNNARPLDPRHKGDRGVLVCLRESDGKFLWQLVLPKEQNRFEDWPNVGICSPAEVEGDRVYLVSNRAEGICLDLDGMADGNDGPFRDEGRLMAPEGQPPLEVAATDADVIWRFDMPEELGSVQHDAPHCAALLYGGFFYAGTSNGVDGTHFKMLTPDAPSLVVLEQATGRLVAFDDARMGPQIIHSNWSSPSLGEVGGRALVFFGGGDGVCYAFEALKQAPEGQRPLKLKPVWRFHCDPGGRKERPLEFQDNREEGPSNISGMPVFHEGRVYVTAGGDIWHGKPQSWLKCIDAAGQGDITKSGEVWTAELSSHCMSTPSIAGGLVYIADCGRQVRCLDAKTGGLVWQHDAGGIIWGSTLVADGKVYVGTKRGVLWVLAAGREKRVISSVRLDAPIHASPVAANGVLYVATMKRLYAFQNQ